MTEKRQVWTILRLAAVALLAYLPGGGAAGQTVSEPPKSTADYSTEPYVVEDDSVTASFENDGTSVRDETFRVRIQSDAGLQRYGILTFGYQGSTEKVDIDFVRVRKPDGTVITTPAENVQDMPAAITREAPFYSDLREKHVSVKGLGVGDVLETHGIWRCTKPLVPGQFWLSTRTMLDAVVLRYQVKVSVPRDRPVKLSSQGVQPVTSSEGSRKVFTWTTSQLEPHTSKDKKEKTASDGEEESAAKDDVSASTRIDVELSSFQSWEAVGDWYRSLARDRILPTPDIKAKAAELTQAASTEDAKIRAIYSYVSSQVHYIGVAFGIGRYQPHAAADVLSNQYGDCKDKHTLLAALLSAVGILPRLDQFPLQD